MDPEINQASDTSEGTTDVGPTTEITAPKDAPSETNSIREAARILRSARAKQPDAQSGAAPETPAAPDTHSPVEGDAAPPLEEAPGETEATDPASEPPIEPPRSWTADEKEAFRALPREAQTRIAERERTRETEFRRSQNEIADQRKAIDAEREAANQARSQYEAALPQLLQILQSSSEFADIKTQDDVERLVNEDWPRYVRWDFHQKKIGAVRQELTQADERQRTEAQTKWVEFAKREDEAFLEKVPELKDAKKRIETVEAATALLKDRGFTEDDLGKLWNSSFLRDHRMQLILLDAVRHQEAKKAALAAVKKPLPPVQRPGVSQPGNAREQQIKDLETKLDSSSGMINQLRNAAALVAAKRAQGKR